MYSFVLTVETAFNCFWLAHGMCHLEASASIGAFILVIFFAPTRFRCRTATTSARFRHGRCGINVSNKEKHCCMGNVFNSGGIIVLWNLRLIEENILDRVWNLNSLAANRCVDVECSEGRHRLCLNSRLNFYLG